MAEERDRKGDPEADDPPPLWLRPLHPSTILGRLRYQRAGGGVRILRKPLPK